MRRLSHWADDQVTVTLQRAGNALAPEEIAAVSGTDLADVQDAIKGLCKEGVLVRVDGGLIGFEMGAEAQLAPAAAVEEPEVTVETSAGATGLRVEDLTRSLGEDGLRVRAEVILRTRPDGSVVLGDLVKVLGIEADG